MRILSPLFVLGLLTSACGGTGNEQAAPLADVATTQAALTTVTVSPSSRVLDFGTLPVGTTSALQTVTIHNGGTTPAMLFTMNNPPIALHYPSNFAWDLPAGESTSFQVSVTPESAQAFSGPLRIYAFTSSNYSNEELFIFTVTATGTTP